VALDAFVADLARRNIMRELWPYAEADGSTA
jgi:hypothetical protein